MEKDSENVYIDEGNSLEIFEDCVKFLVKYNFSDKLGSEIRHIRKLFCIGYLRVYCYTFIKMVDDNNTNLKDPLSIVNLLEKLKENKMNGIIKLYLYKIINNQNQKQLDVFLNKNIKKNINSISIKALKIVLNLKRKKTSIMGLKL